MKKHLGLALLLLFVFVIPLKSQQVVGVGGGFFQSTEATMTFTIGEPVTAAFTNSSALMTQGFNQPQRTPVIQISSNGKELSSGKELFFQATRIETGSVIPLAV